MTLLDDIHHETVITLGDTTLAPVHKYNVGMYFVNSHTCLWKELAWHLLSYPPVAAGSIRKLRDIKANF